jgi:hypothetical protein
MEDVDVEVVDGAVVDSAESLFSLAKFIDRGCSLSGVLLASGGGPCRG